MPTSVPAAPTAVPTTPDRTDRATFSARAVALFDYIKNTMWGEITAYIQNAYDNAVSAAASAVAAALSETNAATSESVAVAAANFKGTYATRTGAAAVPYSVSHLGGFWMLLSNLADVTAKVPGTDVEWQRIGASSWLRKTTTYTAASFERIKASTTAGAWSLTFPAAPSDGDEVEVQDVDGTFATNNLTLLANGKKIMGFTTSWVLDTSAAHLVFVYDAALGDWRI